MLPAYRQGRTYMGHADNYYILTSINRLCENAGDPFSAIKKKKISCHQQIFQPSLDIKGRRLVLDMSVPEKNATYKPGFLAVCGAHLEVDVCSLQTWCCECWHSFLRVLAAAILTGGGERSTTADYETKRRTTDRAESVEPERGRGPRSL